MISVLRRAAKARRLRVRSQGPNHRRRLHRWIRYNRCNLLLFMKLYRLRNRLDRILSTSPRQAVNCSRWSRALNLAGSESSYCSTETRLVTTRQSTRRAQPRLMVSIPPLHSQIIIRVKITAPSKVEQTGRKKPHSNIISCKKAPLHHT